MARKRGRYYLGRIIKIGADFTTDKLVKAIERPTTVQAGDHSWTITHFYTERTDSEVKYVYGRLTKFRPKGEISVVDPQKRAEILREEPNLLIASSPFVYIPEHSGIAYLHVWNEIEQPTFVRRFTEIITKTYGNFFLDCQIEPITDLKSFVKKLSSLDSVIELSAKVNPPNPLFGPLWESLKDYLKARNSSELKIDEKAAPGSQLNTNLKSHIEGILKANENDKPSYIPKTPPAIGDAAILMAADGYGAGGVTGMQDNTTVVIQTSEVSRSFLFDSEPKPEELYEKAFHILEAVKGERGMRH